jgi:hypothetical protein
MFVLYCASWLVLCLTATFPNRDLKAPPVRQDVSRFCSTSAMERAATFTASPTNLKAKAYVCNRLSTEFHGNLGIPRYSIYESPNFTASVECHIPSFRSGFNLLLQLSYPDKINTVPQHHWPFVSACTCTRKSYPSCKHLVYSRLRKLFYIHLVQWFVYPCHKV